jgi:hypothetical protein
MTTVRPTFENLFHTALVPSLFGVRWVKELMNLLVNAVKLEPIADDVMIKFADDESIQCAAAERRDVAAAVHLSLHMQLSPEQTMMQLKLKTLSFLTPLIRSNLAGSSFFDNEFGQVLAVLDKFGLLDQFYSGVRLSGGSDLEKSPVAWLDGIARAILKAYVSDEYEDDKYNNMMAQLNEQEQQRKLGVVVTDDFSGDNTLNSSNTDIVFHPQQGSSNTIRPNKLRPIASNLTSQQQQNQVSLTQSSSCLKWSSLPENVFSIFNSEFQIHLEQSDVLCTTPASSPSSVGNFSLFTASPFLYHINDASDESSPYKLSPRNLSTVFETPEKNKFFSSPPPAVENNSNRPSTLERPSAAAREEDDGGIDFLVKMLVLGNEACQTLKDANIQDVEGLLRLEDDDFSRINLKMGPLVRLRGWVQSMRNKSLDFLGAITGANAAPAPAQT